VFLDIIRIHNIFDPRYVVEPPYSGFSIDSNRNNDFVEGLSKVLSEISKKI